MEGIQIVESYILTQHLALHAVYNKSTTGVIVLSNEMIIDIILLLVLHTISSLEFVFKRGQGHLPYILLLIGN